MTIVPWRLVSSRMIVNSQWHKLRQDTVELPSGKCVDDYFVSVRPEVATIFAMTRDRQVILVKQYKHGVQKITLEVPAGTFTDENPEEAARRELREETSYECGRLTKLGVAYEDATRNTNEVHMFLATECEIAGGQIDDIIGGGDPHIDLGPALLEAMQPHDEPFGGERW